MFDEDDFDGPPKDLLQQIAEKAEELDEAEAEVKRLEAELSSAKAARLQLSENELPELMDDAGIQSIVTDGGIPVEVVNDVKAKIPEVRKEDALQWLVDNGEAGLIDSELRLKFDRSRTDAARELAEELREDYPDLVMTGSVHHSRLKAWAKRKIEAGEEFPHELFGVYVVRRTKIGPKK